MRKELAAKSEREQRWTAEKNRLEEMFLEQRQAFKQPSKFDHRRSASHTGSADADFVNHTGRFPPRATTTAHSHSHPHAHSHRGNSNNVHGSEFSGANDLSKNAELIARLRLNDREIYRQVKQKYFSASTTGPHSSIGFGRSSVTPPTNTHEYYWPNDRYQYTYR